MENAIIFLASVVYSLIAIFSVYGAVKSFTNAMRLTDPRLAWESTARTFTFIALLGLSTILFVLGLAWTTTWSM